MNQTENEIFSSVLRGLDVTREAIRNVDGPAIRSLEQAAEAVCKCFHEDGKVLLCGNGGSAALCQHIAAELVGRFEARKRDPLPAIALTVDSSILTALTNDYSGQLVFAQQVEALGNPGDVLLAYSTSGQSANVEHAMRVAQKKGMHVIGFTGERDWPMSQYSSLVVTVPASNTAVIQELHLILSHALCRVVDAEFVRDDEGEEAGG